MSLKFLAFAHNPSLVSHLGNTVLSLNFNKLTLRISLLITLHTHSQFENSIYSFTNISLIYNCFSAILFLTCDYQSKHLVWHHTYHTNILQCYCSCIFNWYLFTHLLTFLLFLYLFVCLFIYLFFFGCFYWLIDFLCLSFSTACLLYLNII